MLYWRAPHCVEVSPAGVACNPRDAGVMCVRKGNIIVSPTDNQPPPRQYGEAEEISEGRKVRYGAGLRWRAREQLDT